MKTFLAPRVVVPLVVGLVLLGVLLSSADVGRVLRVVSGFHPRFVLFLLALTGLYEVLRVVSGSCSCGCWTARRPGAWR